MPDASYNNSVLEGAAAISNNARNQPHQTHQTCHSTKSAFTRDCVLVIRLEVTSSDFQGSNKIITVHGLNGES